MKSQATTEYHTKAVVACLHGKQQQGSLRTNLPLTYTNDELLNNYFLFQIRIQQACPDPGEDEDFDRPVTPTPPTEHLTTGRTRKPDNDNQGQGHGQTSPQGSALYISHYDIDVSLLVYLLNLTTVFNVISVQGT